MARQFYQSQVMRKRHSWRWHSPGTVWSRPAHCQRLNLKRPEHEHDNRHQLMHEHLNITRLALKAGPGL